MQIYDLDCYKSYGKYLKNTLQNHSNIYLVFQPLLFAFDIISRQTSNIFHTVKLEDANNNGSKNLKIGIGFWRNTCTVLHCDCVSLNYVYFLYAYIIKMLQLKSKLSRMDRRLTVNQRHFANPPPLVHVPSSSATSATSTIVKSEPSPPSQVLQ